MSSDQNRYLKITSIVEQFLIDNDETNHLFQKALSWALWGLRELKLDAWQDIKTCLLDVTDRKTAVLPPDYVMWTKIGVKVGQYCITLGVNDDLTTQPRTTSDETIRGLLSQNLPNGTDFGAYGGYYFNNFSGNSLLGVGGGFPSKGHFKIHNNGNCQEILLDYDYGYSQVYVEYIGTGFDPCGETILNPMYADYVLKYIEMKYEDKNNPKASEASIDRKSRDVFWAEKKCRARANDLDPRTLITISRANTRMTLKQ